ncbi:MAG: glutathione S-transferase C-terminal domain-containing protein, partial [Nannocystaceae bacterium]|nr:glutathione S-transferase C-terminal domain-containing protein [Nannocystaceae bacterium]
QAIRDEIDDAKTKQSEALFLSLPERTEAALENHEYLMGDQPNAADLSVVPFFRFAIAEPADVPEGLLRFVTERIHLNEKFPRTRAWASASASSSGSGGGRVNTQAPVGATSIRPTLAI